MNTPLALVSPLREQRRTPYRHPCPPSSVPTLVLGHWSLVLPFVP